MVKEREIICKDALECVLKDEFPPRRYSLGTYLEDAICMEKINDSIWNVYYGSRSSKDQLVVCNNVVSACLELIHKLCNNDATETRIGEAFLDRIIIKKSA